MYICKSAEALCLEACRSRARNPNSPVPGEGFTPPLPLPVPLVRLLVPTAEPIVTFQNHVKNQYFWKANPIYYDNVDQFWHVDSCWSPLALYCPFKNL